MAVSYTYTTFSEFPIATGLDLAQTITTNTANLSPFWLIGYSDKEYKEFRINLSDTLGDIINTTYSTVTATTAFTQWINDKTQSVLADIKNNIATKLPIYGETGIQQGVCKLAVKNIGNALTIVLEELKNDDDNIYLTTGLILPIYNEKNEITDKCCNITVHKINGALTLKLSQIENSPNV